MVLGALVFASALTTANKPLSREHIAFVSSLAVRSEGVMLGDIADLSSVPAVLKDRLRTLEVARFGPGQTQLDVASGHIASQVRAKIPAASPWFPARQSNLIHLRLTPTGSTARGASARPPLNCVKLLGPVAAGLPPTTGELAAAPCEGAPVEALQFDQKLGVVRAVRDLSTGQVIPAAASFAVAGIRPGQPIFVETTVGPVKIQREFAALQPARPGERLFARAADGSVMSVPYPVGAR